MPHFAEIDKNNVVLRVVVVSKKDAPDEKAGVEFCKGLYGGAWLQVYYDGRKRGFAGTGKTYDPVTDTFGPPAKV